MDAIALDGLHFGVTLCRATVYSYIDKGVLNVERRHLPRGVMAPEACAAQADTTTDARPGVPQY